MCMRACVCTCDATRTNLSQDAEQALQYGVYNTCANPVTCTTQTCDCDRDCDPGFGLQIGLRVRWVLSVGFMIVIVIWG